jgi:hypothetical protein
MKANKKFKITRLFNSLSSIRWNEVRAFKQIPPDNLKQPSKKGPEEMEIDELFSRFTADIIKKDVRFTR